MGGVMDGVYGTGGMGGVMDGVYGTGGMGGGLFFIFLVGAWLCLRNCLSR